jgi:hypothetical protein
MGGTPSSEADGRGGWIFHVTAGPSALIASNGHALPDGQGVPPDLDIIGDEEEAAAVGSSEIRCHHGL